MFVRFPRSLVGPCVAFALLAHPGTALVAQGQVAADQVDSGFPHDESDLSPDSRIIYGTLENGLRYAVMKNSTPTGVAALRMRIATGSLNETEPQRGLAHFLEHMAFNGSVNVPEGEMIKRLERYGLAFGADTNASTGFDQTVYKLNLPNVEDAVLDEAFFLMRETAENLLLDEDAIERERGVIASEKTARDSLAFRSLVEQLNFFTDGSGLTDRLPIGTDETIATMPREEFVSYYRGYYRPENTFVAFIGDIAPEQAIARIEKYFGDWEGVGQALPEIGRKPATIVPGKVGMHIEEGLMTFVTLAALRPYVERLDNTQTRRANLVRALGANILNRRMNRKVENAAAAYLAASVGRYAAEDIIEGMTLRVRSSPDDWRDALAEGEQDLRRALQFGFTQEELDEQIASYRQARETAVERADTRKTYASGFEYSYAKTIVSAFANERVFTSPQTDLDWFESVADTITLDEVETAFREAWAGYDNPATYFVSGEPPENGEASLVAALRASQQVAVAPLDRKDAGEFAYTDFGQPGRVVADRYEADADAHLIRFANNVRLNFKQTDFDADTIYVRVRVGEGVMSIPRKDEGLRRLALNVLAKSGVEAHTADELRSLFAGRRVNMTVKTHIDNDAFEILGSTGQEDLGLQFSLMAAKVSAPAFREEIARQYYRQMRAWYPTHDAAPESVVSKYLPRLIRSGDKRYGYDDLESFLSPTLDEVREWIAPQMRSGPIEITVVGDVEKDAVVAEVARTFGALPTRADTKADFGDMGNLQFPTGDDSPHRYFHRGSKEQALVYVYWPAPDASDPGDAYRMRLLRGLFRNRLTEVLREEMGSTYSPGAATFSNSLFDGFGYIYARITAKPDEVDKVRAGVLRVADEMASSGIDEDAFKRAITPILEDLDSTLENNGYWMNVLGDAQTDGDGLARYRAREATYRRATAEEIGDLAAEVFRNEASISAYILPKEQQPEDK